MCNIVRVLVVKIKTPHKGRVYKEYAVRVPKGTLVAPVDWAMNHIRYLHLDEEMGNAEPIIPKGHDLIGIPMEFENWIEEL